MLPQTKLTAAMVAPSVLGQRCYVQWPYVQEAVVMAVSDARTGVTLHITRGVDLVGSALVPIRGEDLGFFPIEDIHPTRGNTYSGTLEFRY